MGDDDDEDDDEGFTRDDEVDIDEDGPGPDDKDDDDHDDKDGDDHDDKDDYMPGYEHHEYSEEWGKFDLYGYCEEGDWECWDRWTKNNLDKAPCGLRKVDLECWSHYEMTHPPCDTRTCKHSYEKHYYPEEKTWGKFDLYGYCE